MYGLIREVIVKDTKVLFLLSIYFTQGRTGVFLW